MLGLGRLADAALQLRRSLAEAGALLLAHGRRPTPWPGVTEGAARLWSALSGLAPDADRPGPPRGARHADATPRGWPARSWPPPSATSPWRARRCPTCRSPPASRSRLRRPLRGRRRRSRRDALVDARRRRGRARLPDEGPGGGRRAGAWCCCRSGGWSAARCAHAVAGHPRGRRPRARWSGCRGTSRCSRAHGMPYLESFFVADNLERFTTYAVQRAAAAVVLPAGDRRRPAALDGRSRIAPVAGGVAGAGAAAADAVRATSVRLLALGARAALFFMASVGPAAALRAAGAAAARDPARPAAHRSPRAPSRRARPGRRPRGSRPRCSSSLAGVLLRLRPVLVAVDARGRPGSAVGHARGRSRGARRRRGHAALAGAAGGDGRRRRGRCCWRCSSARSPAGGRRPSS